MVCWAPKDPDDIDDDADDYCCSNPSENWKCILRWLPGVVVVVGLVFVILGVALLAMSSEYELRHMGGHYSGTVVLVFGAFLGLSAGLWALVEYRQRNREREPHDIPFSDRSRQRVAQLNPISDQQQFF